MSDVEIASIYLAVGGALLIIVAMVVLVVWGGR